MSKESQVQERPMSAETVDSGDSGNGVAVPCVVSRGTLQAEAAPVFGRVQSTDRRGGRGLHTGRRGQRSAAPRRVVFVPSGQLAAAVPQRCGGRSGEAAWSEREGRPRRGERAAGAQSGAPGAPTAPGGENHRGPKKTFGIAGAIDARRQRSMSAVTQLAVTVGAQAACEALAVPRASYYREVLMKGSLRHALHDELAGIEVDQVVDGSRIVLRIRIIAGAPGEAILDSHPVIGLVRH